MCPFCASSVHLGWAVSVFGDTRAMEKREWRLDRAMRGSEATRGTGERKWHIDRALARQLADGPTTRAALLAAGVTPDALDRRLASGHLVALHHGVYALAGPPPTQRALHRAAVLACGPRAVLSSVSAALEWDLLPTSHSRPIHVTIPASEHRRPKGLVVHRADLARHEVRRRADLLVTDPARTLIDLAGTHPELLEYALNEAYARRLVRPGALEPTDGRRGAKALRAALEDGPGFTRSEAERTLLRLLERAGLPRPQTNVSIHPYEVDALWPEQRLVVEVDGYAAHSSRRAFERDRRKNAALQAQGYRVLRVSYRQLTREPERTVATLTTLLTSQAASTRHPF